MWTILGGKRGWAASASWSGHLSEEACRVDEMLSLLIPGVVTVHPDGAFVRNFG